jgi:hypothetical protein
MNYDPLRLDLIGDDVGEPPDEGAVIVEKHRRIHERMSLDGHHGGVTSNGAWRADVVKQVALPNVGTLPDFGNFCLSQPWGSTPDGCESSYDRYKGMAELLPYAKGVSAKSDDFDANGEQPLMDYQRLLGLVKAAGYQGYIGIEFEGNTQPEEESIRRTKTLLETYLYVIGTGQQSCRASNFGFDATRRNADKLRHQRSDPSHVTVPVSCGVTASPA